MVKEVSEMLPGKADLRDPPEDAAEYINRGGTISFKVEEDNLELFTDLGVSVEPGDRVLFESGDIIPNELIIPEIWSPFGDTIEVRDEENEIISPVDFD